MEETFEKRINRSKRAAEKMIDDMDVMLSSAIKDRDWKRAAVLEAFVNGMKQTQIIIFGVDSFD